jgi:transposase
MPRAIAVPIRQQIVERHQQGVTLAAVAGELGLSVWTVRQLWRRARQRGTGDLAPDYGHCGRRGPRALPRVYRAAGWLRRRHPTWGAGLIRVVLQERWPDRAVPSERTLQRWFHHRGLSPRRRHRLPQPRGRGHQPHAVWQLDATEHVRLANGTEVSWLAIVDEATGAHLAAVVFPPRPLAAGRPAAGAGGVARGVCPVGAADAVARR